MSCVPPYREQQIPRSLAIFRLIVLIIVYRMTNGKATACSPQAANRSRLNHDSVPRDVKRQQMLFDAPMNNGRDRGRGAISPRRSRERACAARTDRSRP
jgi:hypothetical protein